MKNLMLKVLAPAAVLIATPVAICPGAVAPSAVAAQPKPAGSLCRAQESVLFTCEVGAKTVSICGQEPGGAVYRFGRRGHVELEAADLHRAYDWWSGGGETQVYADTPTHRYIAYDQMIRTGFDDEGHNHSKMTSGLLVQSGGRTVSSRECTQRTGFDPLIEKLMPEGEYVSH